MREFVYSSVLPPARNEELAALMFFNRHQEHFRGDIESAIERYGVPRIVVAEHGLRFTVDNLGEVQTLFALDGDAARGRLAGVMLYARTSAEHVVLLHISVDAEYASNGPHGNRLLALRMIEQLKRICRAVKGVAAIEILYGRKSTTIEP
jgi:hypothetical protein